MAENKGDRVLKIRLNYKEFGALEYVKKAYGGAEFSNEQIAHNILINHLGLALKDIEEKIKNAKATSPDSSAATDGAGKPEATVRSEVEGQEVDDDTNGDGSTGADTTES